MDELVGALKNYTLTIFFTANPTSVTYFSKCIVSSKQFQRKAKMLMIPPEKL